MLFSGVKAPNRFRRFRQKDMGASVCRLKKTVNLDAARFEVASLARQIYPTLPEQLSFPEFSMSASGENNSPILTYTLNASAGPFFIQKFAVAHLVPQLSVIPGVGGVKVYGSTPYQWEIRFSSEKIQELGIRSEDIAQSISDYFRKDFLGQGTVSSANSETITGFYLSNSLADSIAWRSIFVEMVKNRMVLLGKRRIKPTFLKIHPFTPL